MSSEMYNANISLGRNHENKCGLIKRPAFTHDWHFLQCANEGCVAKLITNDLVSPYLSQDTGRLADPHST